MAITTCVQCSKEFDLPPSRRAKYCSHACYSASRVGRPRPSTWTRPTGRPRGERASVACAGCGTPMEVLSISARSRKYCSHACYLTNRGSTPRRPWAKVETRSCLVCGKAFEVGGRGRPPRRQRLCSDACQRLSRYRSGFQVKALSVTDAAWIAGFLDGEGTVMLFRRRESVALRVSAANTHRPTLEHIASVCGFGSIVTSKRPNPKHKTAYWWQVNAEAAESLLRQLLPHLVTKRAQAELGIAFQERLRDPALKADRTWQLAFRARMQSLNRRGPRA